MAKVDDSSIRSLRQHAFWSFALILGLAGGLAAWAAVTEVSGAVVANGIVAVEGGSRRVQHPEGGVVSRILARDENEVAAGQPLLLLDDTIAAALLEAIQSQIRGAIARQARLTAESADAEKLVLPESAKEWWDDTEMLLLLNAEDRLRVSRASGFKARQDQTEEQIVQLERQIEGFEAQRLALQVQLDIVSKEETDVSSLASQGLITSQRLNEIRVRKAQREGELGQLMGQVAAARASIAERRVAIAAAEDDFRSDVLTELQAVSQTVNELLQQKIAAEDRMSRLVVRAPIGGFVHQSVVRTVGGVVNAGETLMMIVPRDEGLVIDTRISPMDIDKLALGQPVTVRLAGLANRYAPDLEASVVSISPDLTLDPATQAHFYLARVELTQGEAGKLPEGARLIPGMPAEAFLKTIDRTVLSYLVQPLTDQIDYMFRED